MATTATKSAVRALVVFLFIQAVITTDTCRTGCRSGHENGLFKYAVGTTYKYNYDGKIEISLSSAEGQSTSTEVKATVLLTQQSDCNQVLRLQNVQIIGPDGKSLGSIPDIERPIRLNFHDGHLEDSICVENGDNQNSINVKRAIASAFQANTKGSYETDVFGLCQTQFTQNSEGNTVNIHKRRNLNKCAYREHIRQDFLTTAFNADSEIKSSPILDSHFNSKQKINNGILESASIVEDYLYVPFSVGQNGARAQVNTKLVLAGTSKDNVQVSTNQPRSIIFENPHPVVAPGNSVHNVIEALKRVADTVDVVVGKKTAREFIKLLKVVQTSSKDTLLGAFNQVQSGAGFSDKEEAKRLLLDAILRSGNGEAIETAIALLKNKKLEESDEYLVYLGLNLVRHATESSVLATIDLINQKSLPREAYLGIGNLAGRFCTQHNCDKNEAVQKLVQKLISKLSGASSKNREEENNSIYVLKAIANLRYLDDTVLNKLTSIAQDKKAPNRLRVAALQTFLADACKDKLRNSALTILEDIQQDSEIRIRAYLALAKCPNAKIGNSIKALLENEPSEQVGSFIESHIRSLKASTNPDKVLSKQHLGFHLNNKFPIDPRKYSYNGEFSYTVDTLGLASSSEGDIIYSQNSWLPRSTGFNLTAQVFGHNFNFLEVHTRQENLDRLVEHYFGPKGLLRSAELKKAWETSKKSGSNILDSLRKKVDSELKRHRRDISKSELDKIAKEIQINTNNLNKDLDLDLSVKAFGSEVLFLNINQDIQNLKPDVIIDKVIKQFGRGLDSLKSFEKVLRSNLLFLDGDFSYPTSLGFPLRFGVEGVASIQLKTNGNINVRDIYNEAKKGELKLKIIPSASIDIIGRLTLDALLIENGLSTISNLHSSLGDDLNIKWNCENVEHTLEVKLGQPVKQQELISLEHEIIFVSKKQSGQIIGTLLRFAQSKDFSICLDQLSPAIGLTFCAEINGPNLAGDKVPVLPFPLAGDAKLSVTIENDDVLEYRLKNTYRPRMYEKLLIESVGRDNKVKASFDLILQSAPDLLLSSSVSIPSKSITLKGEIKGIDSEKEKSIQALLDQNGQIFSGKLGVIVSEHSANHLKYKPLLEYKTPQGVQQLPIQVEGDVSFDNNDRGYKITFNNVRAKYDSKTYSLNGNYGVGDKSEGIYTDIEVSDGTHKATLKGKLQVIPELVKINVELTNTINPNVNFNIKTEVKTKGYTEQSVSLQIIHGKDLSSKTNIITFNSQYKRENSEISTKNKLSYPLYGINTKLEYEATPKSVDYDISLQYNDIKVGSELEAKINEKQTGDFDIEFELYGLDNKVKLDAKREIKGDESHINHRLEVNDKSLQVKGKIRHAIRNNNIDVGADLSITLPTDKTPLEVDLTLKVNPNELDYSEKVTLGSQVLLDTFLKAKKGGDANGSLKVNIKDILVINGQIKSNKGSGNADILIDVQSAKKQIKADSTFNIQPTELYNIQLNIYPFYEQDQKTAQIKLNTNTKLGSNTFETKNTLNLGTLEINLKSSTSRNQRDCHLNGEFDIWFPNDYYFLSKLDSTNKVSNSDLSTGQSQGLLEYRRSKNSPGKKVSWKSSWKDTNIEKELIDTELNIAADDSNGQNINYDLTYKESKKSEATLIDTRSKLYGSLLKNPFELNLLAQGTENKAQYNVKATNGPSALFELKGNYDVAESRPYSGDLSLNLQTPAKSLKVLQITLAGSATVTENPDNAALQGSFQILADDDGTVSGAILDLKGEGQVKVTETEGEIKGSLNIAQDAPISADLIYSIKESGKNRQFSGSAGLVYNKGKNVKVVANVESSDENEGKVNLEIVTPVEGYTDTKIILSGKRSTDKRRIESEAQIIVEGKKWTGTGLATYEAPSSLIDLKLVCPEGKTSRIYLKTHKNDDKHFSSELLIQNEAKDFKLESSSDIQINSIDDFTIKQSVNSPNLKIQQSSLEVYSKPGANDKKIQITVKENGKVVISGSTNYNVREENSKYIVEGSGSFKVKEETQSGNFKYIYQRLTSDQNGEDGIEVSFDAGLGQKAIDSEFKSTNKHLRLLSSVCEQKKECSHFEIDSKINSNDLHNYNQVLEVNVDLRKLGLTHEFGLKSVTNRKDWQIDHTEDLHFQSNENEKYQYSLYVHPTEAGVSLTTPKRIVSLESKVQVPKKIENGGKFSGEISLYLDKKNHANKKTSILGSLDINSNNLNGELKLTHPGLPKPLVITTKSSRKNTNSFTSETIIDVFAKSDQKLIATLKLQRDIQGQTKIHIERSLTVKSSGLGVNIVASEVANVDRNSKTVLYEEKLQYHVGNTKYNNVHSWRASPKEIEILLHVLNTDLLKATNKLKLSKEEQIVDSEINSYDNKPLTSHLEVKNLNTVKYSIGYKSSQNKLQLSAGLIPSQITDLRADYIKGGSKINLFFATLKLDDANFLKPDYNVNSKEIENVLRTTKDDSIKFVQGFGNVVKEWSENIKKESQNVAELLKKSAPNLSALKTFYTKELKEIKDEILQDKTLKELGAAIQKIISTIVSTTSDLIDKLSSIIEQTAKAVEASFKGVLETIEKQLIPQLKKVAENIVKVATELANATADIILTLVAKAGKIIEQYQPELKQIAATLGEITQDIGRFVQKAYDTIRNVITEQWNRISEEIKALPIFDEIKQQIESFKQNYAEGVINALKEIISTLKDAVPSGFVVQKEIYDILDTFTTYVEQKIRGQDVNDLEVIEKLAKKIYDALKKLVNTFNADDYKLPGLAGLQSQEIHLWENLPRIVAAKFSPLRFIAEEDISKQITELLLSLVTSPRNLVPPFPLFATVVGGQHIITFDGQYILFPGNCDYVLSRDAINGNFTLTATFKNNELTSITLAEKKDYITLLKGGVVKVNNAAANLPARKANVAAYRGYQMINLRSDSGILVTATPDLTGVVVQVSGFYHGQLRGLLGNGNNEKYDDLTLPDGKIVTSTNDFGNAYKVQSSCQAVSAPALEGIQVHADCTKLFNEDDLKICTPFINPASLKIACSYGLQKGLKDTEINIAKAYVALCQNRNIPAQTPDRLLKCTNSDKTYNIGDKFSVKLPKKAADIVLVVQTVKNNEQNYKELLQPVVQDIGKELHSKGINDVEFHLIVYGGDNKWPSHVTVNGKLTFKGKAPNLVFGEDSKEELQIPAELSQYRTVIQQIQAAVNDLRLATGLYLTSETFGEAYKYPFRTHALKSIVILNSEPCQVGRLGWLQKLRSLIFRNEQISLNLFTPVPTLDVKDGKKTTDVIGFSSENVFLLSQGKKNAKGSSELVSDLTFDDFCIDFTLKNRGNVFVTENFESAKADGKKTFTHVAAVNVVHQLTAVEQGLDCECQVDNPWAGVNRCKIVYSQENKNARSKA